MKNGINKSQLINIVRLKKFKLNSVKYNYNLVSIALYELNLLSIYNILSVL